MSKTYFAVCTCYWVSPWSTEDEAVAAFVAHDEHARRAELSLSPQFRFAHQLRAVRHYGGEDVEVATELPAIA